MPVLVITGQRDGTPGFDRLAFILATVEPVATNVRGTDIPGAAHWLAEEQPQRLAALLLDFFR